VVARRAVQHKLLLAASVFVTTMFGYTTLPAQQNTMASNFARSSLYLGTAWYPEQWPQSRWELDLALMQEAGIRFVRVGEFSWSTLEPKEGHFNFTWLDRAIELAAKHGIDTVLATPSAAPPAWLTQKYPETLRVNDEGRREDHGNRQQYNWANETYRRLTRQIVRTLAERYGHNPNVIGWQIDNEYGAVSYDPDTKASFQRWLETRYRTIENLNDRWSTPYWSQAYTDWAQIPIPIKYANPGLYINWMRFVSDTWRSYQRNQLDTIRRYSDHQFVTTNLMGWFDDFDFYTVTKDLDLASWDDYVRDGRLDPTRNGILHDRTRGLLRKNFWVMEMQTGSGSFNLINNALEKGETRAMAWHAIGHGADAICYWQWRTALNGQEQYTGTLLGVDGLPNPLYAEIAQIGREFDRAGPALARTFVHSEVAIIQSYESRWAIDWQLQNENFSPIRQILSFYAPIRLLAESVDIVSPTSPLDGYKLVIAPGLNILTPEIAQHLTDYVMNGGHLVLGQRSGMKDVDSQLWRKRQPGPMNIVLGAEVEQYYALRQPVGVDGLWGEGQSKLWAEYFKIYAPDVKVIMRYEKSNGWLDNQPAAVTRKVGKGRITYIGAWLDDHTMRSMAAWLIKTSNVRPRFISVPDGVDEYSRSGRRYTLYILINFSHRPQKITLPRVMQDVLANMRVRYLTLRNYDVRVLETPRIEYAQTPKL
jgi:beta-galactosidase